MKTRNILWLVFWVVLGSTGASAQDWKSILGDVLQQTVGGQTLSEQAVIGQWQYASPYCRLESDELLAKAGGQVAASQVESRLESVYRALGMEQFSCSFAAEGKCSFGYKGKEVAGTYTLDTDSGMMTITLSKTPATIRAQVSVSGNTLSMAFEADRLISALKSLTDLAAGISSQAELIGSLVESYDGLWLGFELQGQ
ncbi:MAG TPA: DUF4923 family protein [Candidatus Merdimorpha stercoravium]|uniref:DUF4923 family protein n=1 Tax=Candidatus Merdimorpha stercoravium TaxID=2840863 RepID=A0A9D1HA48_9FLAO|nr:DUF4923 family protein [Candidatus Merdimorpha stercoravium]